MISSKKRWKSCRYRIVTIEQQLDHRLCLLLFVLLESQSMLQAHWLPFVDQASFNEIYVMDAADWRILHANPAACENLQYRHEELVGLCWLDLLDDTDRQSLLTLSAQQPSAPYLRFDAHLKRLDGSRFLAEMRFSPNTSANSVRIAVVRDIGQQREAAMELDISKSLFSAIVSNTPGLVYQFQQSPSGQPSFTYLSEGCQALLGLSAEQLCADPSLFLDLILPDDRVSYLASMGTSSQEMKSWNWEGRIWVEAWKDIKWINLRATPHQLPDQSVQWNGIMSNITQSKLEQYEIKRSRSRLAELSAHIEHAKELERTQLAREVHDDLGGNLTAIKMALALLANRLPADNRDLVEKAAYVNALVDRTIESAHRIARDLRPSILDFGLVDALEWQSGEFEKQAGIPCTFTAENHDIDLPPDQAAAVFRIFQEALTNVAKHAQATQVSVSLSLSGANILLAIADNGRGMTVAERLKPESFGIRGMTERAQSLGGKLMITPTDGGGSTVTIKIPKA